MWTFLGVAGLTYIYKKADSVLTLAYKEPMIAATLFLTAGLLLSYIRYFHGDKLRVSQVSHLFLSFLSSVPFINHLIPQTSTERSGKAGSSCGKVR